MLFWHTHPLFLPRLQLCVCFHALSFFFKFLRCPMIFLSVFPWNSLWNPILLNLLAGRILSASASKFIYCITNFIIWSFKGFHHLFLVTIIFMFFIYSYFSRSLFSISSDLFQEVLHASKSSVCLLSSIVGVPNISCSLFLSIFLLHNPNTCA